MECILSPPRRLLTLTSALSVALPLLIFISHARLYGSWIIDDAGITFSYARNLAQGYGLVSQPGLPPVEGYSNFLWVLACVPFFLAGIFDPVRTPKLLSLLFIIACFVAVRRLLRRCGDETGGATFLSLSLLSLNTSFVAWCVSGLENPLYALLLALLAWQCLEALGPDRGSALRWSFGLGATAAAVAMTRPEGVLFFPAYPLIALATQGYRNRRPARAAAVSLAAYALPLIICFGGFLAFRLSYFHELLPNTYYAKMQPVRSAADLAQSPEGSPGYRLLDLVGSVVSARRWDPDGELPAITPPNPFDSPVERRSALFLAALLLATAYLALRRRFQRHHLTLGACLLIATGCYLALPPDWMEEYRYATGFFLFLYLYMVAVGWEIVRGLKVQPSARLAVATALGLCALVLTRSVFAPRTRAFVANPTVPLEGVREWLANRFDGYADALGIQQGSLLVPDLGGTLFYSRLRIYDLGMLCDKTIARTMGKDQPAFYDYIFNVARPTFIHTHGSWSYRANLDGDPRFRRDYLPIAEHPEYWRPPGAERAVFSGDYVRKDAVAGKEEIVRQLGGEGGFREARPGERQAYRRGRPWFRGQGRRGRRPPPDRGRRGDG